MNALPFSRQIPGHGVDEYRSMMRRSQHARSCRSSTGVTGISPARLRGSRSFGKRIEVRCPRWRRSMQSVSRRSTTGVSTSGPWRASTRRACALLSVARSMLGSASRMFGKDVPALAAMRLLSAQYPRFGYWRIHVFLERQEFLMGHGQLWRLWRTRPRSSSSSGGGMTTRSGLIAAWRTGPRTNSCSKDVHP